MADNEPVPQPKKVKMPPMTEADKKKLGMPAGSPAPSAHGGGGGGKGGGGGGGGAMMAPPMMGSSPMCTPMMGGGYPGIGGMGPNLVFNFNQPYGYMMAAVAQGGAGDGGGDDKGKEEEKEEEKPKPEGKPLKKEPCVIQ
ncbi:hypothetical protein MBANPS3_007687 [Mucor bainieri]